MFKKMVFILLSTTLCSAESMVLENPQNQDMSVQNKILLCGLGAGGIAAAVVWAPVILPAGAVMVIKGTVVAAAAKIGAAGAAVKGGVIAAGPIAFKINLAIKAARIGRPYIYENPNEKLNRLLREEALDSTRAKEELADCLENNNVTIENGSLVIPNACQDAAMMFAMFSQVNNEQ